MDDYFHTDGDGDVFRILTYQGEQRGDRYLRVATREADAHADDFLEVVLLETNVRELRNYLTAWLDGPGASDPEPVYTALVRRLVTEEVARVLPLHLSPQADAPSAMLPSKSDPVVYCAHNDGCTRKPKLHWERDGGACAPLYQAPMAMAYDGAAGLCVTNGCTRFTGTHLEHDEDPEPHDVGIVDEPPAKPRLMAEVQLIRSWKCAGCIHSRGEHMGGMCWGPQCKCTQYVLDTSDTVLETNPRPSTDVPEAGTP